MKTTWEFSAEDITDILTVNKKTFSYLKGKLSRFYLQVTTDGIDLFFKDTAGILKYHKNINYINKPTSSQLFAMDYQKFLNSLLRFQAAGALVNLTDSSISIVDINNNTTVVKLSSDASDDDLQGILSGKDSAKSSMIKYDHSEDMNNVFSLTGKLMNNGNPNNCLAIMDGDKATYADRSLIYKEACETSFVDAQVSIHAFLLGFIITTQELQGAEYYFDFSNNALYFKSAEIEAYLLSERPDISVPSDDDLKSIRPDDSDASCNVYKISAVELSSSLDFFEGFFERDIWKPITFVFNSKDHKLAYTSPVTEVEKPLECNCTIKQDTEFTLMSTPLQAVLSDLLSDGDDVEITIVEKPDMPGISMTAANKEFELVLAKLNY